MSAESGWRRITEVLDRHGVEYLIVGGVAARLHLSVDEARALPIPLDGLWLAGMDVSTWRTDAGDLDVLMALPTRNGGRASYEELVDRAARVSFAGVGVLVAALDDVIASKEWADRPKDREALVELRKLADTGGSTEGLGPA